MNWKQAENALKKVHIPAENCESYESSGEESGYDSEIDAAKNETPEQVCQVRAEVRNKMMQKWKGKKTG